VILTPPVWQMLLSVALLVLGIMGAVWFAARVYRVGILMYGKRPTFPEIMRWVRHS
jgi:ABC-2 type transport system permease protein